MTKEEALTLKKGNKITGDWIGDHPIRTISLVRLNGDYLEWSQVGEGDEGFTKSSSPYAWPVTKVEVVERAEPVIINTYPLY